jgi:type I restriction enzyme, S subunit
MGQLCSIASGKSDTKDAVEDGPYAFFDRSRIIKKSSRYLYDCDALIIPGEGTEFLPKQFSGKFDLHQRAYALFSFSPELDIKFLYYFLHHRSEYFPRVAVGATVKSLRRRHFEQLPVAVPSLPEQRRIVGILDEAFEGIDTAVANTKKNLANARELFNSYLDSVFTQAGEGWKEKTLGELADHSLEKMLDKQKNRGVLKPYLRNLNVRWFGFDLSYLLEMPFEEDEREQYTAVKGDVLICEGGYPGRAAIWDGDEPVYFQKAIHRVRFEENAYNKWFVYFLYHSDVCDKLRQYFTGSGIQHFTGQSLHKFVVPIPPTRVLMRFVEDVDILFDWIQNLESTYRQKLANLADLKQAILRKAFAGELTAQPEKPLQEAAE